MTESVGLVVVGSGIASSVFLHRWLARASSSARVLVLEKGPDLGHAQQLAEPERLEALAQASFRNDTAKPWRFSLGFGGSSNCWYACTPRLLPSDFRLASRYGVAVDWPLDYDELEPFYCDAEDLLSVAGPSERTPFRRSRPYPLLPHALSSPDRRLAHAFPDAFFVQPTARPSRAIATRPACCGNAVCSLCPVDAKFTVRNGLGHVFADPRVELRTDTTVLALDMHGGQARGVRVRDTHGERTIAAELVVLGANAVFNPHILLRSGLSDPGLGHYCHEQAAVRVRVNLRELDGLDGSTIITGHGYMLYDGEHRHERAAVLIETINAPQYIRTERGRWRQILVLKLIMEELPDANVRVDVDPDDPAKPRVRGYAGPSDYVQAARQHALATLPQLLESLPVESIEAAPGFLPTESHILGTTRMGHDPQTSVVDRFGVHHRLRNVVVVGGSTFPTSSPANPSLTIAALALRCAEQVSG